MTKNSDTLLQFALLCGILFCCAHAGFGQNLMKEKTNMQNKIISARALDRNRILVMFDSENYSFEKEDVILDGALPVTDMTTEGKAVILRTPDLDYRKNYTVKIDGHGSLIVDPAALLDDVFSDKPLGASVEDGQTVFRLFAPRATSVSLVLFENHDDVSGAGYDMVLAEDGVWEYRLDGTHFGKYYGYKIAGPNESNEHFAPERIIADPYAKAVTTKNSYLHEAKSIIVKSDDYDWEGDEPVSIVWEDLVIYEMHVRDMTVHPSSEVKDKGTYRGLVEKGGRGGIEHILELGVNAVELLPCHDFANIEIPYGVEVNGMKNTWNPYERNHWGYMTSYFFAPESYYASDGTMQRGAYNGIRGQQVAEFKDMVKAFHREGIAVIMDVVYNHVSHYDLNPFKYIDKKYYFRLNPRMEFLELSGCGNDFKTERPMARRMIVDSIKHWMQEYHIDGFRFDLATMLDWETIEAITAAARKINPDVILIAEPWGGGGYDLGGFSERGWAAWNDLFRNGVKGQNPVNGLGWIFGHYWNDNTLESIKRYVRGSLKKYRGPFVEKGHSINYLESHDDHTLGDFIRIGTGRVKSEEKIRDITENAKLTDEELKLHKLAAAFLLTSQGAVMIGEGQEFARSKVIAETSVPDPHVGQIDHNSYNKDNETNWLNFEHKELNRELFDYYRGLIELRNTYPAFRRTPSEQIQFLPTKTRFAIGYLLPKTEEKESTSFIVMMNANPQKKADFKLPEGTWRKVVDEKRSGSEIFGDPVTGAVQIPARTVLVLKRG